jgi:bis(5'-nucleosyl)-tetraphosphatase (symmetrical)
MAIYAIGDLQGCYDELQRLLEIVHFDPAKDILWFAGDLVNRGPKSLQVLRFVKSLGSHAVSVLGNHDLHLLAISQGNFSHAKYDHLSEILEAPDRQELTEWLRHQPVMYHHTQQGYSLIHAGLPPQWDHVTAQSCARELEAVLRGPGFSDFCQVMYGDLPNQWNHNLNGMARLRFITNCFTRLRYCSTDGQLYLSEKGPPETHQKGALPWYNVPNRRTKKHRILFGHWSTLGYRAMDNVWSLDSGCCWGGQLTALQIIQDQPPKAIQLDCS